MTKGTQTSLQPVPAGPAEQGLSSFHPAGPVGRASLTEQIQVECEAVRQLACSALPHALTAGELLIQVKAGCRHGEWGPWLDEHFPMDRTTATNWMRLARNRESIPDLDTATIPEAIAAVRKPRKVSAESEPAEDEGEAQDGEVVVTDEQEKGDECGGQTEQGESADDEYVVRPAEPGEIEILIYQMEDLASNLELYTGMERMAQTVEGWIESLKKEMNDEH